MRESRRAGGTVRHRSADPPGLNLAWHSPSLEDSAGATTHRPYRACRSDQGTTDLPTCNLDTDTLQRLAAAGLDPARLPRHVAIIMDGNGRWAQQRGLPRVEGHGRGVQSVRATVEECCRLGIEQLTLFCLSVENRKRPQEELNFLMMLLLKYLRDERAEIMEQNIRFSMIGRRADLSEDVLRELDENIRVSAGNVGMVLCLAINYGGRTEIVDAVRTLAAQAKEGKLEPASI